MASKKEEEKKFNINDYKGEIDKYIKERVEIESASNVVKIYKKQLRDKTLISTIKSVIILILILIMVYGGYRLYKDGYFDRNKEVVVPSESKKEVTPESNTEKKEEKEIEEDEEKKKQELIDKYSYLLKNINIDSKCDYLNDFYSGKLTTEMKEYLAYKVIDQDDLLVDDTSIVFEGRELSNKYKTLFTDEVKLTSFKYNGVLFKYLDSKDMFISTSLSTKGIAIQKEIIDVKEDDSKVVITTVEGLINNNRLYNVLTNKEVSEYKANSKLENYKNKLNVVKYNFENELLVSVN